MGPTPRRAQRWLDRAALCGVLRQSPNRPIARRIRRRRELPEPPRVSRLRLRRIGRTRPSPAAVGRAGRRRCTWPRTMAIRHPSRSCCCAAPTGPSRTTSGNAALRRTAEPKTAAAARAQVDAEAIRGTVRKARGVRGGGEPGALRPPAHSPPPPFQRCWYLRMFRRSSPSALADPAGREATQHSHCNGRPRCAPRRALLHRRVEV